MKKKVNNIQNIKLYESLSALTQKSLEIITKSDEKVLNVMIESTWVKHDNDTYIRQDGKRALWSLFLENLKDEITRTEEFNSFSEVTNSDEIVSSQLNTLVGTYEARSRLVLFDIVFKPIYSFLTDTEIIGFESSIFKAEYLKIEKFLYSNEIELERLTPLCGFFTDADKIFIDDNISIVKMSDSEIIKLLKLGMKIGDSIGSGNFIHHIHQFAIKVTYKLPKLVGDNAMEEESEKYNPYKRGDIEQTLLNALRLFKDGIVYSLGTVYSNNNIFDIGIHSSPGILSKPFMKNKFQLVDNDNFLEFWKTYRRTKIQDKHFLSVAIRRFSQSNERESIEDKIIDFMISAEALFLSSGGSFQGELRYRLSHRAAMFIEDVAVKQREVFNFMQKAYNVRSDIVHGREPNLPKKEDGTPYSLREFCKEIENHLRFSLKKAIMIAATTKNPKNIIDWNSIIFPKED